jgi:hypothetical protein
MRDDFTQGTKNRVAKRVGSLCSNPDCQQLTSGPQVDAQKVLNIGVAAHITAASPNGPRYDPSLSTEKRSDITNGIWLCQNCAKLVDSDPQKYTSSVLHEWKALAEQSALQKLEGVRRFAEAANRQTVGDKQQRGKIIERYLFTGTPIDFYEVIAQLESESTKLLQVFPIWYSVDRTPLLLRSEWAETVSVVDVTSFDLLNLNPRSFGRKASVIALEEHNDQTVILFVDGYDLDKDQNTPSIGKPFREFTDFVITRLSTVTGSMVGDR